MCGLASGKTGSRTGRFAGGQMGWRANGWAGGDGWEGELASELTGWWAGERAVGGRAGGRVCGRASESGRVGHEGERTFEPTHAGASQEVKCATP